MKPSDLKKLLLHVPCSEGVKWAKTQPDLPTLWYNCERPEWLFWILDKFAPLEQGMSVRLAVKFAESALEYFEKAYPDDKRPRLAIEAAQKWADEPTEENKNAAAYAAYAATNATNAACADCAAANAACAAANAACATNAACAANAANAAANAANAACAAEKNWQCALIRSMVPNPFEVNK